MKKTFFILGVSLFFLGFFSSSASAEFSHGQRFINASTTASKGTWYYIANNVATFTESYVVNTIKVALIAATSSTSTSAYTATLYDFTCGNYATPASFPAFTNARIFTNTSPVSAGSQGLYTFQKSDQTGVTIASSTCTAIKIESSDSTEFAVLGIVDNTDEAHLTNLKMFGSSSYVDTRVYKPYFELCGGSSCLLGASDFALQAPSILDCSDISLFEVGEKLSCILLNPSVDTETYFRDSIQTFQSVFPFNLFFDFTDLVSSSASGYVASTSALSVTLPAPMNFTVSVSSSTVDDVIGSTTYQFIRTLETNVIWLFLGLGILSFFL